MHLKEKIGGCTAVMGSSLSSDSTFIGARSFHRRLSLLHNLGWKVTTAGRYYRA